MSRPWVRLRRRRLPQSDKKVFYGYDAPHRNRQRMLCVQQWGMEQTTKILRDAYTMLIIYIIDTRAIYLYTPCKTSGGAV